DPAKGAGPGVVQPELALINPRRMGHRQAAEDSPTRGYLQHAATVTPAIAPAVDDIAGADRGHVACLAALEGQAIEVTAVLSGGAARAGGPPQRREVAALAQRGQAAELGVHEYQPATGFHGHVVDIEIPRRVANPGNIEPITTLVQLAGAQDVLEAPELIQRA